MNLKSLKRYHAFRHYDRDHLPPGTDLPPSLDQDGDNDFSFANLEQFTP